MAITINWSTKVISVPKADMLLVQATPLEIRELDINSFRLVLKDLEDDEEGMSFVRTHDHNPPVSVGGVILARVISIINGYTITFEDGQYAVNIAGGNSNIGDVINANQVSVRSANSAGLVQLVDPAEAVWTRAASGFPEGSFGDLMRLIRASQVAATTTALAGTTSSLVKTGLTQPNNFYTNLFMQVIDGTSVAVRRIEHHTGDGFLYPDGALPFTPTPGSAVLVMGYCTIMPAGVA